MHRVMTKAIEQIKQIASEIGCRFIPHYKIESWGLSILIMERSGKAFGRLYQYNDDSSSVYLDWLSVDEDSRNQGIGTELQEVREKIGVGLGATTSCLWVRKDTWMHDWYKRRGYIDFQNHSDEENAIWMKKPLNTKDYGKGSVY